jgi:uncharacterized protein YndB with AHSA1/START domain
MNTIIVILAVIAGIIVLFLLLAAFAPKGYSIYRDIIIDRPVAEVFSYIRFLKNQEAFSKWVQTDPNKKTDLRGTDGTVGCVYAWEGNKQAGKGEQEITEIEENERINIEVRFIRPFEAIANTPFVVKAMSSDQTNVKWGMTSSMKYPMNAMLLFMSMEKMLGKDLEISLASLKKILENKKG